MSKVIGLCGGSGAGKSTVAALLEKQGAERIDADEISREISAPGGAAYEKLRQTFPNFFDEAGLLMRRQLGAHVFANPGDLERLERITHPAMRQVMADRIASSNQDVLVLDCAILTKPVFRDLADELWVVTAPESERIRRIMERDSISEDNARKRLEAQEDEQRILAEADRVIVNDGNTGSLLPQLNL